MQLDIQPLGATFAASVRGIDLRLPPDAGLAVQLDQAIARYGVLVFPGQPLDPDQQHVFMSAFGPRTVLGAREAITGSGRFIDVGNVDEDGKPIPSDSTRAQFLLANQLWHTDGSFKQPPIRLTCLLARVLPPVPPPTEFADMRAAWQALPQSRRAQLEGLTVVHSILRSREQMGMNPGQLSAETVRNQPLVVQPLVRTHRLAGQQSLYLASHASHVVGWPVDEGRALLRELIEFATQPRFVYSHAWSPHDLVMWDNSWTMHRATPYDAPHPRHMRQCSVLETTPA